MVWLVLGGLVVNCVEILFWQTGNSDMLAARRASSRRRKFWRRAKEARLRVTGEGSDEAKIVVADAELMKLDCC